MTAVTAGSQALIYDGPAATVETMDLEDTFGINHLAVHDGHLGMCSCPGWPQSPGRPLDLAGTVEAIRRWPVTAVVSLMEMPEFQRLGLSELPERFREKMPLWLHLPIRDRDVPGPAWLDRWRLARLVIAKILLEGDNVVIHCLGGLGRTGTVAALCLIDAGRCEGQDAINEVRLAHSIHAVETSQQQRFVRAYRPQPVLTETSVRPELERIAAELEMRPLLTAAGRLDLDNTRIALEQTGQAP